MKKIMLSSIIVICLILTGCDEKECVKWKTTTTGGKDCSTIDAGKNPEQYKYCKMFQEKQTTTQECIEWK